VQGRELSLAQAHASATLEAAQKANQLHKETLVSVLDLLAPSCVSPLLTSPGNGTWASPSQVIGEGEGGLEGSDASEFYDMRLKIASSTQVGKQDAQAVVDRLTCIVGNAVYAAERAAQVESALQSRKAAAEASARSNIPALQAEIERAQMHVSDLVELIEIKEGELEQAHSRLSHAADTAEGLANTLKDQETEIHILHAALEDAQDEAATAVASLQRSTVQQQSVATQVRISMPSVRMSPVMTHACPSSDALSCGCTPLGRMHSPRTCQHFHCAALMQTANGSGCISPQEYEEDLHSRLVQLDLALQAKERHIQQLQQELAAQQATLHPHLARQPGMTPPLRAASMLLHLSSILNFTASASAVLGFMACSSVPRGCFTCRNTLFHMWIATRGHEKLAEA
jgi:hypothetical protein